MKNRWNKLSAVQKTLLLFRLTLSFAIIILAVLQLSGIRENLLNVAVPLLGAVSFIRSIEEFKTNRFAAIIDFCIAVFILICSYVVFFVK